MSDANLRLAVGGFLIRKVWSDAARRASAEARASHHVAQSDAHIHELANPIGEASGDKHIDAYMTAEDTKRHQSAADYHKQAAVHFTTAAHAFALGRTQKGNGLYLKAERAASKATHAEIGGRISRFFGSGLSNVSAAEALRRANALWGRGIKHPNKPEPENANIGVV